MCHELQITYCRAYLLSSNVILNNNTLHDSIRSNCKSKRFNLLLFQCANHLTCCKNKGHWDAAICTKTNETDWCHVVQCAICSKIILIDKQFFAKATAATDCADHCKLTVHSDAPRGSLSTDGVSGSAAVVPSIAALRWLDNQRVPADGDPCVRTDSCASFAPLDRNLCPSRPATPQRHISSLHRYCGDNQTNPCYCIYRKKKKKKGLSTCWKLWSCSQGIDGDSNCRFVMLLMIICGYQRKWKWIRDGI